jgi:hypothetical protein
MFKLFISILAFVSLVMAVPAMAQITPLTLTPDKSATLALPADAASVVVANPAHANVFLDTPRLLVIVPKAVGTTKLSVMDAGGKLIAERQIIITDRAQSYVRITRMCGAVGALATGSQPCQPSSLYYCPASGCVPVATTPINTAQAAPYPSVPAIASAMPPALPVAAVENPQINNTLDTAAVAGQ